MCGISVLVDRRGQRVDPRLVTLMNARVVHRGPNDEGLFEGPGFVFGHQRLSIIDLSRAGRQPMEFHDRSVITYNGEIYNYLELRAELEREGYSFRTSTDTEVLLAAYDRWGEDCVRRFNGMWAFVLWDRKRGVLFCSRDRFGVKPLHYVELSHLFAIGSEVKQFLALPGFVPSAEPISTYRFLMNGMTATDELEFASGVRSLRGGHNLRYRLDTCTFTIQRWYDLDSARADRSLSFGSAAERFHELLSDAVRVRLRSDVAVGVCLSGGIDSSSIASLAKKISDPPHDIRSVSCVWDDPACDESRFIDAVIQSWKLDAVISRPNLDDLLSGGTLDRLVYHHDQPLWSASQFSEYAVFQAARAHGIVVMLGGQGADEYLAGYDWFFEPFIRSLLTSGKLPQAIHEIRKRFALRGRAAHLSLLSLWNGMIWAPLQNSVRAWCGWHPLGSWAGSRFKELHRDDAARVDRFYRAKSVRDLSLKEMLEVSMPHQLHSEDRNSMLQSIESRIPFLDYRLVEFGVSLADEFKWRDGMTKAIVREGLRGVLPDAIRNRHDKVGFPAPEEQWVRRNADVVRRELAATIERYPEFLTPAFLERFDQMLGGASPYDSIFFRAVALNRWTQVFSQSASQALFEPPDKAISAVEGTGAGAAVPARSERGGLSGLVPGWARGMGA